MKTAKKVEIPKDRALQPKEAEKLLSHAKNSSFWYFTHGTNTENKVRRKLLDKGFSKEAVFVSSPSGEEEWDFIELAIEHCKQMYVVDDAEVAEAIINTQASRGHGSRYILYKLQDEGFDREESESFIESFFDDDSAFEKAFQKATRKWHRLSEFSQKEYSKSFAKLASEGFPQGKIREELEILKEDLFYE